MANLKLVNVNKIYNGNVQAVFDFNLEVKDGEFIVLVGPSGCGKSTTLNMIAGLEGITSGDMYIDGVRVNAMATVERDIAMVFQSYALYPQLSVHDNMGISLKIRHDDPLYVHDRVKDVAQSLSLDDYLNRLPANLSGGQKQRVALGRAVVRNPKIFLMDEPLSNLDAKLRTKTRSEIVLLQKKLNVTTVYVTHDQIEAMTMADRIVVMNEGYVQQIDSPFNVYNFPANIFVGGFIGLPPMNFVNGIVKGNQFIGLDHSFTIDDTQVEVLKNYQNKEVVLGIRPENIYISTSKDDPNAFTAHIDHYEYMGKEYYVKLCYEGQDITANIDSKYDDMIESPTKEVKIYFDMKKAHFFDKETTNRIVGVK